MRVSGVRAVDRPWENRSGRAPCRGHTSRQLATESNSPSDRSSARFSIDSPAGSTENSFAQRCVCRQPCRLSLVTPACDIGHPCRLSARRRGIASMMVVRATPDDSLTRRGDSVMLDDRWVAVAESSTPRLIGVHGKPGLRGLSPSHLRTTR
jgi:hypothetical protein